MATSSMQYFELGQSIWYDNIQRGLLRSGAFKAMVDRDEIRGVTSNPTIFQNAIAKTNDYDEMIQLFALSNMSAEDIFFALAIQDIQDAADILKPLYDQSDAGDGYVSLEVSPLLAHDTEKTIQQAIRLWKQVDRPNLMIKIPATLAGIPAIKAAIAEGINVNVTLIFSLERYAEVMEAYLQGLEDRVRKGLDVSRIASVASFFVSRVDSKVDGQIVNHPELQGKTAVANAVLAYQLYQDVFSTQRYAELRAHGARAQRPLWASTSTKNPDYPDLLYVDTLVAPNTVNTVPPKTLIAILDHGIPALMSNDALRTSSQLLETLSTVGVNMQTVTKELEEEGVASFIKSYEDLLKTIEQRKIEFRRIISPLPNFSEKYSQVLKQEIPQRIITKDFRLWTNDDSAREEIEQRLGWLTSPSKFSALLDELKIFSKYITDSGYTHCVLLGMGGSSMAPEVYSSIQSSLNHESKLKLIVLDSTDPEQVLATAKSIDPTRSLFIVASKSGSTAEINALFAYFWSVTSSLVGAEAGKHFVAITDPGTSLEKLAQEKGFLKVFHGDPLVGGRFSALTPFGLVPAALIGLDLEQLLEGANKAASLCNNVSLPETNPGLNLGILLAEATLAGKNKLTVLSDTEVMSFGAWLEQLIAESTGKLGKGIIPVDLEPKAPVEFYQHDRLFSYFYQSGQYADFAASLAENAHPIVSFKIASAYDLGFQFYLWEYATAVASSILGVNAFDQPDVQDSKTRTVEKINQYEQAGSLPSQKYDYESKELAIAIKNTTLTSTTDPRQIIVDFLAQAKENDYIAVNAYLPRDAGTTDQLQEFRKEIMKLSRCATTLGFGPRFLHSTGQLHKGGVENVLIVQITRDYADVDLQIPGKPYTFGVLQEAQAQGDLEALVARGRKVLKIHLKNGLLPKLA